MLTDLQQQLVLRLNHPDMDQRLEALRALRAEVDAGRLEKPAVGRDVNNHIHTTYSFSPYSPTMAAFKAWQAGLATAGIMDHDAINGAREFTAAGEIIGIATTIGAEIRASFAGTFLAGRRVNNPDQPTVVYLALHGVPHTAIDALDAFLKPVRDARGRRNARMTANLAVILQQYGIGFNYEVDVLPLSLHQAGGEVTERHILYAVAQKLVARFGTGAELVSFLEKDMKIVLADKIHQQLLDSTNPFYNYNLLGVLKSDLVARFYVPATDECLPVADVVAFADAHGIILAYPYLGDVTASVTGDKKAQTFEDNYLDELFELLSDLGFQAVTYMPSRNTRHQMDRLRMLCEKFGFFQISGEDINQPRQSFVCVAMRDPQFANLYDAAWALIGHERLATDDLRQGFLAAPTIARFPDLNERIAFFRDFALNSHSGR